ncbi:MAG: ROK family protein [Acidobacteriota bacterium]
MAISEKSPTVLGLDIGGTEIKSALVNFQGDIIASRRTPTPRSLPDFEQALRNLIEHLNPEAVAIRAAGIGCKGIIDPGTTEVLALPGDLNYLEGRRLSEIIAPVVPAACPVAADNDARVALVGECRWGAARGRKNAIMLTLGTGLGGAILAEGNIVRGAGGVAGHLGHITVDPSGGVCMCGNRGCLQTVFSARAIESEAFAAIHNGAKTSLLQSSSRPPSCHEIFECARKGDKVARLIVERAITFLGSAIAGLVHALDPEVVILGGNIAEAGDCLFEPIQHEVDWRTWTLLRRKVPIVKAQVPDPSGVVGAAALAIDAANLP